MTEKLVASEISFSSMEVGAVTNEPRFHSTDDARSQNVVRHEYRTLTDAEKRTMTEFKDAAATFIDLVTKAGNSRELSLAITKIEEATFWAVKHVTR